MGKKQEDNRDVFEKALDDAKPYLYGGAGALAGGLVGSRFGTLSRAQRAALEKQKMGETLRYLEGKKSRLGRISDDLAEDSSARMGRGAFAGTVGGATGAYASYAEDMNKAKKKPRK